MRFTGLVRAAVLLSAALSATAVVLPEPVRAEPLAACPEGRRSDGGCVNPRLAGLARTQAICYSQVKLSFVVCPGVLPAADLRFKFPFNVVTERQQELDRLFERRPF